MKSEAELPVSAEISIELIVSVGAVVSTVTVNAFEAVEVLLDASFAVAVIALLPAVRVPVVQENVPLPLVVQVLPVATPPTYNCTVELASAVPVITRDVFLVIRSLLDDPVSLFEARARVVGAVGAVLSGSAATTKVATDVPVADSVEGLREVTVFVPTTIDLINFPASEAVNV